MILLASETVMSGIITQIALLSMLLIANSMAIATTIMHPIAIHCVLSRAYRATYVVNRKVTSYSCHVISNLHFTRFLQDSAIAETMAFGP